MNSIKINGGSFTLSAVLAYRTEAAFVKHNLKLFPTWLTEQKRAETLKEIYRLARELKKQQDGNSKGNVEPPPEPRSAPDSETADREK